MQRAPTEPTRRGLLPLSSRAPTTLRRELHSISQRAPTTLAESSSTSRQGLALPPRAPTDPTRRVLHPLSSRAPSTPLECFPPRPNLVRYHFLSFKNLKSGFTLSSTVNHPVWCAPDTNVPVIKQPKTHMGLREGEGRIIGVATSCSPHISRAYIPHVPPFIHRPTGVRRGHQKGSMKRKCKVWGGDERDCIGI